MPASEGLMCTTEGRHRAYVYYSRWNLFFEKEKEMPQYGSKEEVKEAVKDMLVDKGIDENSADYLGTLYAESDRGKANLEPRVVAAASCSPAGIIPIGG